MKALTTGLVLSMVIVLSCNKDRRDPRANDRVATARASDNNTNNKTLPSVPMGTITSHSPAAVTLLNEGRQLQENFQFAAATERFKKAIAMDPGFSLAHAHLVALSRDDAASEHRRIAKAKSSKLPKAEKLLITSMIAEDIKERRDALAKLAIETPNDWRVQLLVARSAQQTGELARARSAFERAANLNPTIPYPHNHLAYLYAEEGDYTQAVAAVTRYAELSPGQPNPLDSKGDILLMAGRFNEAAKAFSEALTISPSFAIAHEGIAATKFYQDEWQAGIEELKMGAAKSERAIDRHELLNKLAWAYVASKQNDKATRAFRAVRAAAKAAGIKAAPGEHAIVDAEIALTQKAYRQAAALADQALAEMNEQDVPAVKRRWGHVVKLIAASRGNRIEKASATLTFLEDKDDHYRALARGHLALAKGEYHVAIESFRSLEKNPWFAMRGQLLTAEALQAAGDHQAAASIRSKLASQYRRDIYSIMISLEAKKIGRI